MPPRIPRIQPEAAGVSLPPQPSLSPTGLAELATRGSRALATELGRGARQAEYIYAEQQRIDKTINNEQDRIDAEQALNQYKLAVTDNQNTVTTNAAIPAAEHAVRIEDLNRKARETTGKTLRTDASRRMYERGADAIQTTAAINARAEARATQVAGIKAAHMEERRNLGNTVVFGQTQAEREGARLQIETGIADDLAKGWLTAGEAEAERRVSRAQITEGEIRRDLRNPATRVQVVDNLLMGRYTALPAEHQLKLADTIVAEDERQRKDREREAREQYKEDYKATVSDLYARAEKKTLTEGELDAATTRWQLTREDQKAIRDAMVGEDTEPASDRATLDRVEPKVYSLVPRVTETELDQLRERRLLNRKDHVRLKSKLEEGTKYHLARGESEIHRQHSMAEKELKAALGIPDIFDKLEPKRESAWRDAIRELNDRSSAGSGKEDPRKVAADMIPRYQKRLGTEAQVTEESLLTVLKYPNHVELKAAADRGEIKGSDLDNQKRLLMDLERVRKDRQFQTGEMKSLSRQTETLGGAAPKPPAAKAKSGTAGGKPPVD